ncbi:hypothetical protein [Planococcus halocryophilus]|uniref:hypothetical protein n=1 Tax=Planococcus halocryophilus TaxID=1215089 RepID=UPI001F117391|nr:hypothetical protein [Planococcus halocryophilus]MCH4828061.1 hypothetical protein [Planococcus halocryophilus]
MKFFYFKNKMYDLAGWPNYIDFTGMYLLDKFCELEQLRHYNPKKKVDWDIQSYWFFISDKELSDFANIKSRTTLKKHIDKLIKFNLIETKEDRAKNHKGKATQYRIVKPLPLPPEVKFSETYIKRYGEFFLEQIFEDHKALISTYSAQKMDVINEEDEVKAPNICAPRKELELERKKERSKIENLPKKENFSETQKKIVLLCEKYIQQPEVTLSNYFKEITSQKEELILSILEKNSTNGFKPSNAYQFVLSLFTDNNELEKLGAATLNETNGFSKKTFSFPEYADKKETSNRRAASKTTGREYYDELFANLSNIKEEDIHEMQDAELQF